MQNANIIMSGLNAQPVNALAQGQAAGQAANDYRYQRDYQSTLRQHGAGAMNGNQASMNALAAFDPAVVQNLAGQRLGMDATRLGMDQTRLNMDATRQGMRYLDEDRTRAVQQAAAQMTAQQREQQAATIRSAVAAGMQAQTPQQWDSYMSQSPETQQFVGRFAEREMIAGGFLEVADAIERSDMPTSYIASGESAAGLGLDPNGAYNVTAGRGGVEATAIPGQSGQGDDSAKEQQIARLMEGGIDRGTAIALVDGRFVTSRNEQTGAVQIIDKATGQVVQAQADATQPQAQRQPEPQAGTMPEGTDFATATGLGGFLSQLANTASDTLGGGLVDPNNERATQAMQNLSTNTMIALADSVAGRPSNFLLEQFQALTATPNSIWQGPGRTREKLNQTRSMIAEAVMLNQDVLRMETNGTMRAQATQNIARLQRLLTDYDAVIQSFGSREPGGGSDLEDRLRAYE